MNHLMHQPIHHPLVLGARPTLLRRLAFLAIRLTTTLLAGGIALPMPGAQAAMIVFDPQNFSHNIMTDIQTLRSNIHEATQIANQMTQIANEAKNLTTLPYSVLQSFASQYGELISVVQGISGLVNDVQHLEANFQAMFPDFSQKTSFTGNDMVTGLAAWRTHLNGAVTDSMKTGAQVLRGLPASQQELNNLLQQSQGAVGALQALQSGNQIAAGVAGQLLQLNAQMATYQNAHLAYLAAVRNEESMSARRKADLTADWTKKSVAAPAPRPGN